MIPFLDNVSRVFRVSYLIPIKLPFPPNHNFTGRRKELAAISRTFESLSSGISDLQKVVVLHGLGGIGKTQIAYQYAYSSLNKYTFIGWIDATNAETISSSFLEIAQQLIRHHASNGSTSGQHPDFASTATALGMPPETFNQQRKGTPPETATAIIDAIKRWFCAENNRRWLLVVDNYDDIKYIDIGHYLPRCFHGHILVTSRARDSVRLGTGLEVAEIALDDGTEILRKSAQYDLILFKRGRYSSPNNV